MDSYEELAALRSAAQRKLEEQERRALVWQSYFDNEQGIVALLNSAERETFRTFLNESAANWCELVVQSVAERLQVDGFRYADKADSDAAWEIWQASSMDADSELVHTDALVTGSGLVLVQRDEANPTGVSITPESPFQACVLYEPGSRRRRRAGYKKFADEVTHGITEVLILPDWIVTWHPGQRADAPDLDPNPAGVVSLIELVPQPRTLGWPRSELESAVSFQDRINTTLFARMVSTDFGAFRQTWATGLKLPRQVAVAEDGTETTTVGRPFNVGADRLLVNENPEGKFGSMPGESLRGLLDSVEQDQGGLAAVTQTPAHYLQPMINLSADAIKASETGLIGKVRRRGRHLGEGWEESSRLSLQLTGRPGATDQSCEVIWADMETRSLGQLVDALVKLRTLGVPLEVLWQKFGASPQEIDRWRGLATTELEARYAALVELQERRAGTPVRERTTLP